MTSGAVRRTTPGWLRRSYLGGAVIRARSAWRRSLRLRVLAVTTIVGFVALAMVSAYLSDRVRDTLYDQRVAEALADAATRTQLAQQQFDTSTATTSAQVQIVAQEILRTAQSPDSGAVGTLLRRPPYAQAAGVPDISVGRSVVLSDDLREAVREGDAQQWQAVAIPLADGEAPGIAVGALVDPPEVGPYELYFVYSLAPEQDTLILIQQTLVLAALALVALLAAMALYLTRQVLGPVQQAAKTAERLANGHLDERMTERGRDELASLGRSFNEMAESLQDQIERLAELAGVQQRFVSDVSHELRTPLTTIRMASELIHDARGEFDPATRRSAELLHTQVDRFEALLGDLLEISRFDAGAAMLDVEHVDLRTVVRRSVDLASPLAERTGTWITLHEPEVACRADLDPRRVERVLRNLLENAIEHAEERGIDVYVAGDESAVAVSVVDHGIGMTMAQAGQVFERFWRADPSRARTIGGTGLGLAIALEDARLHGGALEVWARPGVGATFRLTLPRRAGVTIDVSPGQLERIQPEPDLNRHDDADSRTSPAGIPGLKDLKEER